MTEYLFEIETIESGQKRKYSDSYYTYKITSNRPEHEVKAFCMNVLRKSYPKDKMPNAFACELLSFKKITNNNKGNLFGKEKETYEYKTTELYTG